MSIVSALDLATGAQAPAHVLSTTVAQYLWLLPVLPLLGAIVNGVIALGVGRARGEQVEATTARHPLVTLMGPGVLLASFALALAIFVAMLGAGTSTSAGLATPLIVRLGSWIPAGALVIDWAFQLDQLSMLMVLVITGVGTLIHIFSVGYMRDDAGYARYFAYLNLFVAFMLVLVLGASYPVLFIGWEGVGLCSYLLISFWFRDAANVAAGTKAFVVNRIGDAGFLVAMFLMWRTTQHLDFAGVHAALLSQAGTPAVVAIALCLFIGCTGKSAQLPLYVWLPDAMAGPTPVSALIHAATMVTAGVYLVARAAPVFSGAPSISLLVTVVGALTALFAATIALRQWDIKKVLAYSTVSQLGYMFMAVGSGAYTAGVFHLVTHAFFKALLFLGAGSVIHAMHAAYHATHRHDDLQDLRNMGGLRRVMPVTAVTMGLATLAIAGVPPLAGFFSKDAILSAVFARASGSPLAQASLLGLSGRTILLGVYAVGMVTALFTAVYMGRLLLLAFFGENRTGSDAAAALHEAPGVMTIPVVLLAILTVAGGWLNLPELMPLGRPELLDHWLAPVTGASAARLAGTVPLAHGTEQGLVLAAVVTAMLGLGIALMGARRPITDKAHASPDTGVAALLANAYHVDAGVDAVLVRPTQALASVALARGVEPGIDGLFRAVGSGLTAVAALVGRRVQDGDVGKYAWVIAAGAVLMLAALSLR